MGPSILFDKSAIQSLGRPALQEVSRYFYTVVPPVLLMETLADLSLKPDDLDGAKKKVAQIADKVFPINSIANAHCQTMCVHNLLGDAVPMTRVPAVAGGRPVMAKDGSKGIVIDIQPENEAVMRWRNGDFNADDLKFAIEWRENAKGSNLEAMKQALPKPPIKIQSAEHVGEVVDLMLSQPEFQEPVMHWFLSLLRCDAETIDKICVRWKWAVERSLIAFAPYAYHCLRAQLIYYIGMMQGFFGTRPSNIVDMEYLCYTPFAFVFCSGDKLHGQLAPFVLQDDQSFVGHDELRESLNEMAAVRKDAPDAEPGEDSLIRQLWIKHWKKPPPPSVRPSISEEESRRIMESVKPIMDAIQEQEQAAQPRPRFPVPAASSARSTEVTIRPETDADHDAIQHVNREAFGQEAEAQLVDALRDGGFVRLSLVAELDGQVVGHILFSDIQIVGEDDSVDALALAPMAVVPEHQRKGIGSELVRTGLEQCRQAGHRIVIVLGHPNYYPRFGFSSELATPLQSQYAGEAFMALELAPGALEGVGGEVKYSPPFEAV